MTHAPFKLPKVSNQGRAVFSYIHRRGGSMRIGPLMRGAGLESAALADALDELDEFYWITIQWRWSELAPSNEPLRATIQSLTYIDRVTGTRFGRRKHRTSWPDY